MPKQVGKGSERENKNYRFVSLRSDPTRKRKFKVKQQKNSINLKIPLWLHFKPKQVGKGREREKIEIVFPFRSYLTGNRKFQKKEKKNQKIKKYHCGFIPSQNRLEKAEEWRK